MLDQWLREEHQTLLAAILEVDSKIILLKLDFVGSEQVGECGCELAVTCDLCR